MPKAQGTNELSIQIRIFLSVPRFPKAIRVQTTEVSIAAFYIYNPAFRSKVFDLLHESIL